MFQLGHLEIISFVIGKIKTQIIVKAHRTTQTIIKPHQKRIKEYLHFQIHKQEDI